MASAADSRSYVGPIEKAAKPRATPGYRRIANHFRREIAEGRLLEGTRLPSEIAIMRRFDVSRITARQAISLLASWGLVETRHGSGSFVAQRRVGYQLYRLSSFAEEMRRRGMVPASQVLAFELAAPPPNVREVLGLRGRAHRLERLRLADGRPLCFDVTWIPPGLGQRLKVADLEQRTLYDLYETELGVQLTGASHRLEAVSAPAQLARLLSVRKGDPMLAAERVSHGLGGAVLDWQRRWYRADRFRFELELLRHPAAAPDAS